MKEFTVNVAFNIFENKNMHKVKWKKWHFVVQIWKIALIRKEAKTPNTF